MGVSSLVAVQLEGPAQADAEARLLLYLSRHNYATHKHPDLTKWLARHQQFHPHFTLDLLERLNRAERWFHDLTERNIRQGTFGSVPDDLASIETYLEALPPTEPSKTRH